MDSNITVILELLSAGVIASTASRDVRKKDS